MGIIKDEQSSRACDVAFSDTEMIIYFEDGKQLYVPLEWLTGLRGASRIELENWRLIGNGESIHWEDLDKDISIESLLQ